MLEKRYNRGIRRRDAASLPYLVVTLYVTQVGIPPPSVQVSSLDESFLFRLGPMEYKDLWNHITNSLAVTKSEARKTD